MKLPGTILSLSLAIIGASMASGEEHEYLKAFPPAAEGMVRYVIELPHKERGEDENFRVEVMAGRQIATDGVNTYRMGGTIEAKPLKGWGFTYYEVEKFGAVASTLMAAPPGTTKVEKFVSIPSITIPYNSRIPLVVYVPEGGEVRFRIWKASETTEQAHPG